MARPLSIAVVSDIHFASPGEQLRGRYEQTVIRNPLLRWAAVAYRRFIWLKDPFAHNHLLTRFLRESTGADFTVANGDYSCDSAFVGVSDEPSFASAATVLNALRSRFPGRLAATLGDHELGKLSLFGGAGGLRLASWRRCCGELGLRPFWQVAFGRYQLVGVASSLLALPVYAPEALPEERPEWSRLREAHLREIQAAWAALDSTRRVILFCHDPTALPFLWQEAWLRERVDQLEMTVVGHLHTKLVFQLSRALAGIPAVDFLGNTARRLSRALREARLWRPFKVRLCPSLAGSELLKDGGFGWLRLELDGSRPASFEVQRIPRSDLGVSVF